MQHLDPGKWIVSCSENWNWHNCMSFGYAIPGSKTNCHMMMERCFEVRGKVQNVMFRQTVIRAMIKRGLSGGASNDKADKALVRLTLRGESESIDAFVELLRKGTQLNDWGARATRVDEINVGADTTTKAHAQWTRPHQVTTDNVDSRNWNPNVTMFI